MDDLPVEEERGLLAPARAVPRGHLARLRGRPVVRPQRTGSSTSPAGSSSTSRRAGLPRRSGRKDRPTEKAAFERFVDHVVERRRRFPGMHVYHYAAYERTALTRLMGEHATREEEIDDLLRGEVLVDLFRVTKQALRASVSSYSIKEVEELYGFERTADVERRRRVRRTTSSAGSRSGSSRSSTGSATTTARTASRSSSCTAGCSGCGRTDLPWRLPPDKRERSEEARGAAATSTTASAPSCSPARRRAIPTGCSAQLIDYHRARRGRSGGRTSTTSGSTRRSSSTSGETLGGLELAASPCRVQAVARVHVRVPAAGAQDRRPGVDPATERPLRGLRSTTSAGR